MRVAIQMLVFSILFGAMGAIEVAAQDCNIISKANDILPDRLCAPVSVNWRVTYRGVNDGGTGRVAIRFDWDDGSPMQTINAVNIGGNNWEAVHNHVYPIGGDKCNYHPRAILIVDGVDCTSSIQEQIVTVWDTDDLNGGEMQIDPVVFPICVGNDGLVTFFDVSQWNCTPPDENDVINNRKRWIQWIYGTDGNITTAQIGGVVRPWPYNGAINMTNEPIEGPIAPWNQSLPIYIPVGYNVGDFFEVTLRNWNYCNPYDDPNIPGPPADLVNGDYPPVITTAIALIVALPDATITPVGPFCANNSAITLKAATSGGVWSGSGITNPVTGVFNPAVAGPGLHTITYQVTDGNGCSGVDTEQIRVYEVPVANISTGSIANLCPGATIQLDGQPSGGTMPYAHLWSGDTAPLNNTLIGNPLFSTTVVNNYNLVYTVTDAHGCKSSDDVMVVVDLLKIEFANPVVNVCQGTQVVLDPDPSGGSGVYITHQWSGDRTDLLSATNVESPSFNAVAPGVYKYRYHVLDNQGCEDADSIWVNVYEMPISDAGIDAVVCGLSTQMNAIPSVGIGTWQMVSGPAPLTFVNVNDPKTSVVAGVYGTYLLKWLENNVGCEDEDEVLVKFVQQPNPKVMDDADTCALTYRLIAFPSVGAGGWVKASGPGNSVFAQPLQATTQVTVDVPGVYEFAWVEDNGDGCVGSDTLTMNFFPVPDVQIAPFDTLACTPYSLQFQNLTTNADSYLWTFGDGFISNEQHPLHVYENLTTAVRKFQLTLFASNVHGCSGQLSKDVYVAPGPKARFAALPTSGCSPLLVNFTNQSQGAISQTWSFGDGTDQDLSVNTSHLFTNGEFFVKAFEVSLAVENGYGCVDTARTYITVFPGAKIDFQYFPPEGCSPLRVDFMADAGAVYYEWDFGNGIRMAGSPFISHLYQNTGVDRDTFNVTLYSRSNFGCRDTSMHQVIVAPSPVAAFNPDKTEGCAPLLVNFDNTSSGAWKAIWKFDGGEELETLGNQSVSRVFLNSTFVPIYSKIRLVVENEMGCRDSIEKSIQVFPAVGASIETPPPGCSPLQVTMQNYTVGGSSFLWDFGDGVQTSGYTGSHVYNYKGDDVYDFRVSMLATSVYGCKDTAYTNVRILPTPEATFSVTPTLMNMPESTVTIVNETVGNIWSYNWIFGDGQNSTAQNPGTHRYNASGEYDIWLKVSGGACVDSTRRSIRILPMLPVLDYGAPAEGCPLLRVKFYNRTVDALNFIWEFGDGAISSEREPEHVYYTPGTYRVKLTAIGPGGVATGDNVVVVVYPKPTAYFEANPRLIKIPGRPVAFINRSEGAVSATWDFGDGSPLSTDYSPMHEYLEPGVYDVTLEVVNDKGCPDTYIMREAVVAEEGGKIKFPNAFTPNPSGSNGGVYVMGAKENFVFYPFTQEGVMEYKLQIFTRWGELIFESHDIAIGWDGYFKGKLCQQGVYIWKAVCKFSDGSIQTLTGDVTLLR
jgi:gliding motility-associated-like protein